MTEPTIDEVLELRDEMGRLLGELLAEMESARNAELPLNADALEAVEKGAWAVNALAILINRDSVARDLAEAAYEQAKANNPEPASIYHQRAYNGPMLDLEGEAADIWEAWKRQNVALRRPNPEPTR